MLFFQLLEPDNLEISQLGVLEVQCRFLQLSMHHSNRKFVWKFTVKAKTLHELGLLSAEQSNLALSDPNGSQDLSIMTPPLLVVRQRLKISLSSQVDNEGGDKSHVIWYKDEGGKDHGIDLTVTLVGPVPSSSQKGSRRSLHDTDDSLSHSLITGQEVPLIISLHYANGDSIYHKPNLFSILPDAYCTIDKHTGRMLKKIRIHDISKNHQRQLFRLKVTPDITKAPQLFDIAGDESEAIEVRSKRTKRQRDVLLGLSAINGLQRLQTPQQQRQQQQAQQQQQQQQQLLMMPDGTQHIDGNHGESNFLLSYHNSNGPTGNLYSTANDGYPMNSINSNHRHSHGNLVGYSVNSGNAPGPYVQLHNIPHQSSSSPGKFHNHAL